MSGFNLGKIIRTTSDVVPFYHAFNPPGLRELQNAVDGYIEIIQLPNNGHTPWFDVPCVFVAHSEALAYKKPVNLLASEIAGRYIAGDVVVLPRAYVNDPRRQTQTGLQRENG